MTHGWLQRAMPLIVIAWAFLVGCSEQGSPGDAFLGKGRAALSTSELKTYWVVMRERANLSMAQSFPRWDQRGQFVYSQLRTTAGASQEGLRQWLAQRGLQHETFWIVNTIQVEADAASISEISRRPDVARVVEGSMFSIPPLQPGADIKPDAPDWGGEAIRAPEVWEQFGARGEGITVATIDTGVDFLHPALENKYRGKVGEGEFEHDYNFFDPSGFCGVEPCDSDLHGTHVTGTMVGDDEVDAQIGIAPDAQWIAAVGCPFGGCPPDVLLSAGEWILAPTDSSGNDPRPELRPHVVNNSWGGPGGDEFYREIVQSWVSAGIFPVFSAGNEGLFGCSSSGSPGDYPESYSVAAFDEFGFIADFSSRGPTGVEGVAKPDIAAPGVDVLSSVPGGGYELLSGTSMAAPHVAGTVALMWSAAPSLVGDVNGTREILGLSAINVDDTSCGGDAEHNGVWGEGKLDAFAAVDQSPRGPTGTISGDLVSITGQPIAEARVTAEGEETSRTARSDAQGDFAFRLPVGSYEVNARAFGFEAPSPLQAQVNEGETTRIRFRLQPAPTSTLSGRVLDEAGEPLGGATVRVLDTPLDPVVSDESGFFTFGEIPRGTYQIRVDAGRCFVQPLVEVELLGDQELSVEVAQRIDEFGYSCRPAPFQYVEATEPVSLFGFEDAVAVELPFPFAFYGQTYEEVTVTSSGFLSFEQLSFGSSFNSAIPDPALPNAAIYAFWDELTVEPGFAGQVFTATLGEAPNRRFVVEWREVLEFFEFLPVSFEIVLHENGQIELLYNTTGNGNRQLGGSATVGLEDERGELAFQYSLNEPILEQGTAILFSQPPSGFVEGQVVDSSDGLPLEGATVRASAPDFRSRSATTNSQGLYRLQLPVGEFELEVTKEHYSVATVSLSVQEGDLLQHDFVLDTAALQLSSRSLQLTVPVDESRSRALVLSNAGALDLQFEVAESGGRRASPLVSRWLSAPVDVDVRSNDTRALFAGGLARPEPRGVLDTGDILEEFTPNEFVDGLVQVENHLWLSAFDCTPVTCGMIAREYTLSGERTGREWLIGGGNMEAYGMAYDEARGLICQVALRFDSFGTGIECWDPDTGNIEVSIPGSQSWGGSLLRALAYNASDDTFFVSDVGDPVFHVAGASWAEPGEQLGSCAPADRLVSGLAYNDSAEVLWAATNSPEDTLYQLNPSDCSVLGMLEHPGSGSFKGGRLDMNSDGNLWMVNQSRGSVLLVDSGLPVEADVPWLSVNPSTGFVSPGGAVALTIDIHTAGLEPGLYLANLVVRSNSGREPRIRIPVSLLVPAYRQAVNVGGDTYFDALGDAWEADQSFDASGDWGYFEPGTPVRTLRPIANTDDDPLFQAVRMAPYAYRFESIPNGVYEVELGFAEIIKRTGPGDRLFDVIVEQELVLPAYDIAFEVGTYRADRHSFFTEVTDGRLDLRLVGRSEQAPPLISAVRVTHRPDR